MKPWVRFISACLSVFCLSVSVCAAPMPGEYEERDGNTYVGTFKVAAAPADYLAFWKEWKESPRNVFLTDTFNGEMVYAFLIIPDGATFRFPSSKTFACSKAFQGLLFERSASDASSLEISELRTFPVSTMGYGFEYIVTGTYFDTEQFTFPDLGRDYLVNDYQGGLIIVDDLEGEQEGGLLGWLKNLWDWLCNFFETLKNLILSLFVPRDGFFDNWFAEVRAAFDAKLGGLSGFIDYIKGKFSGLSGSGELNIVLPEGMLYSGSAGASVSFSETAKPFLDFLRPVLTGFLALLTIIHCYKRLISLTHH